MRNVQLDRRALLGSALVGGTLVSSGSTAALKSRGADAVEGLLASDLRRYAEFGDKISGGPGDNASGTWIEERLRDLRYTTERQEFPIPSFSPGTARLEVGGRTIDLLPQLPVLLTSAEGLTRRLEVFEEGAALQGSLAVVVLPFRRWSSIEEPEVRRRCSAAFSGGAAAVLIVTNGPTGEAIALNAALKTKFPGPLAILAPAAAEPIMRAARRGETATLVIRGELRSTTAFNVVGRANRGADRTIVLSTPRSGWFTCAGERGPGLVAWLHLAAWIARERVNVVLVCTSGHEREYVGGEYFLTSGAPRPTDNVLWVHLGANVATRDWHDLSGKLLPLPSADPQRYLVSTPEMLGAARAAFSGLTGLEQSYPSTAGAAGELKIILAAGYPHAIGIFGAHRFHHVRSDTLDTTHPLLVKEVVIAFQKLLGRFIQASAL